MPPTQVAYLRTAAMNLSLERAISRVRLEKYLQASNGDLDRALTLYERNARLSEALYFPLQSLEICLRNFLSDRLAARFGDNWLTTSPLGNDAVDAISEVKRSFQSESENLPGKIIADLRFAFWVGLIGPRYDNTLWRATLYKAFVARGGLPRKQVHGRLNALRRLRNRIAHHEPIFHKPLDALHDEIIEAIGWMCPDTAAWTLHHSRFNSVHEEHAL